MTGTVQRTSPDEWQVVVELYPSLRRFAAVTAPPDMEPDDLLQEALVKVLTRRSLGELDHPAAYLQRTMVNLAVSHGRRMRARRRALQRAAAGEGPGSAAGFPSDLADLLTLPPGERAALYLAEVEGFAFGEIGRMLGCSEEAARKRASRGRSRLRLALATEDR